MGRYITLLLFIGMMFGQDVLKTVSGKEYKGKYLKAEGGKVFFIPEGASSPTQVPIVSINEIITETGGKIFIEYDPETGEVAIKQLEYDPETGEVVKKQGDDNVLIRLQNGLKVQGEFIGTYMNHVHILIGEKIIYYACDDIISITYTSEGLSTGKGFNYDCNLNTVTADILFPPELDPMTGEMKGMLPHMFNPLFSKDLLYLKKKRNPAVAGMLSFFLNITGSGHLYAGGGNIQVWYRSIPYSLVLVFIGLHTEKERDKFADGNWDQYEPPQHLMMAHTAAYIGLIWDSVYMTRKYNIKLHNEIYDYEIKKVSELKQFESELKLRQAL